MISFWEKNSFLSYDYIIIGAGLMGMHIAYELHEKEPNAKIIILERGIFPTGASTKNAGFACFGSLSEIVSDIAMNGVDNSLSLIEKRYKGISLLKERLGIENIGYENNGGYELLYNEHLAVLEKREEINELLFPIYKNEVFSIKNEKINEFGFDAASLTDFMASGRLSNYSNVVVKGLMGMASFSEDKSLVEKEFNNLKNIYDQTATHLNNDHFDTLSMGMSGDYALAIEKGSNLVRIGSLLFGARN
jgi:hypothetical protein